MKVDSLEAFEYVLGTLEASQRKAFKAELAKNQALAKNVHTWEERLNELNDINDTLTPRDNTLHAVLATIDTSMSATNSSKPAHNTVWSRWFPWFFSAAMSLAFVLMFSINYIHSNLSIKLPVDYVALLTDEKGDALLTAVTEGDSKNMWLQWEQINLAADQDLQIWAISKSDQEVRSIAIIGDTSTDTLLLSEAHWRLIKDAKSLIVTLENEGGSVIDEPSDQVLAKGLCVRLKRTQRPT